MYNRTKENARIVATFLTVVTMAVFLGLLIGLVVKDHITHVPATRIAPEVCHGDGRVLHGTKHGSLLYVYCADGMVKLYYQGGK